MDALPEPALTTNQNPIPLRAGIEPVWLRLPQRLPPCQQVPQLSDQGVGSRELQHLTGSQPPYDVTPSTTTS
jgi:hypothetical protein